jgi:hypothetical protein
MKWVGWTPKSFLDQSKMVARDWMRMYKVKRVHEVEGGDFLAAFRFMEESLSWRKDIWRWPAWRRGWGGTWWRARLLIL